MNTNTTPDSVALRDQGGTWYVLSPEVLAQARATDAQQAQLERQAGDDTAGFGIIVHDFGNYRVALWAVMPPDVTAQKPPSPDIHAGIIPCL